MAAAAGGNGGRLAAATEGEEEGVSGVLEVTYDDLVRALREASPAAPRTRRAVGGAGATVAQGSRRATAAQRVRGWWRERRLRSLTERAIADDRKASGTLPE